jgi:L-lysine 6-transaminase
MNIGPTEVHGIIGKYMLADGFDVVMDLKRSHGSIFYDSKKNREMLDFFTCFASSPIGYNHPKLTEESFLERMKHLCIHKPSNSDIYTVEMALFVDTFARLAKPSCFKHLFFISGGALAIENGLKVAFDWKVRKNRLAGKKDELGHKVIHFEEAFHGRSGYTLSLTNTFDKRKTMYFTKFDWPRFKNPKVHFPLTEEEAAGVQQLERDVLSAIKQTIAREGDDIAAIIIEPIQGEGGDNHFRGEFLRALSDIAHENDIMYILDEVQTGLGLTGKMWCYEHFGFEPDIVAFGKKTQVCGIMVSSKVDEVEENVFACSGRLNSTWGGNLIDMVRCQRYLEIIDEENLIENAATVGIHLLKEMETLAGAFSGFMENVRGRGLMIAFCLPDPETRDRVFARCLDENLLVLKSGAKSIRFRPPLTLTRAEADRGVAIIRGVMEELYPDYLSRMVKGS